MTIYREYRPQNFDELVGQNHIKTTLKYEIEQDKIAHAYLFCGPRGIGKTTIARVFAKAINCVNRKEGESEPCNTCDSCEAITLGKSVDVIEIDAASHTGVDNVRENIIAVSKISTSGAKFKVFIIDEVHMLSISAFNALLKVIEEPPKNVIFILATTEVHKIPATIISRCQRFDFKRINVTDVVKKLQYIANQEKIEIDSSVLEDIARQSEGHMRDAESVFGQIIAIAENVKDGKRRISQEDANLVIPRSDIGEAISLIELLVKKDAASAIALVNKIMDEGVDLKRFLKDLIELLRKIMLAKINLKLSEKFGLELGEGVEVKIAKILKEIEVGRVINMIEKFTKAGNEIKESFIIQLPIEVAIIELCSAPNAATQVFVDNGGTAGTGTRPQAIRKPDTNQVVNTQGSNINLSTQQVMAKWNEFLNLVKKNNHSLSFVFPACVPGAVANGVLKLAFKFKFHRDRVEEPAVKAAVVDTLQQVFGMTLAIETSVDEGLDVSATQSAGFDTSSSNAVAEQIIQENQDAEKEEKIEPGNGGGDMLDSLLKTFGGKVVG